MKKVFYILTAVIIVCVMCSCVVHTDPMGEYAKLDDKDDVEGITRLIDDLLRAKDYTNAGAVLTAVGKTMYKYKYEYEPMLKEFSENETEVGIEAWSYLYNSALIDYFNAGKETNDQLQLMRTYHELLDSHFADTHSALAHVGDQQYMLLNAPAGEFISHFGTAANGKALVYIAPRYGKEEEQIKLGLTAALPEALLPSSLEEVEYAVVLRYTTKVVGTYTNNGEAMKVLLEVSVVHYPDGNVLKTYPAIEGDDPPTTISTTAGDTQGKTGSDPDGAAIAPVIAEAFDFMSGLR